MRFKWVGSPNFGLPRGSRGQLASPEAIVYHIAQGTMAGLDAWFGNPVSGASSHFGVSRAGEVHQYVRVADASWANGEANRPDLGIPWLRRCVDRSVNPNLHTVTIEHEGYTGEPWPEAQYQASLALTHWILKTLDLEPWLGQSLDHRFIGHCRIDSVNRARCPGAGWPRSRLFADLRQKGDDGMGMTPEEKAALAALAARVKTLERLENPVSFGRGDQRVVTTAGKCFTAARVHAASGAKHSGSGPHSHKATVTLA